MVTCTGHIGIHEGADGRTYVRTLYVRTDVHDVMAIKPNFLTSMGYHIFLTMVLRARSSAITDRLIRFGYPVDPPIFCGLAPECPSFFFLFLPLGS